MVLPTNWNFVVSLSFLIEFEVVKNFCASLDLKFNPAKPFFPESYFNQCQNFELKLVFFDICPPWKMYLHDENFWNEKCKHLPNDSWSSHFLRKCHLATKHWTNLSNLTLPPLLVPEIKSLSKVAHCKNLLVAKKYYEPLANNSHVRSNYRKRTALSSKMRNFFANISRQLFALSTIEQGLYLKISHSKLCQIS